MSRHGFNKGPLRNLFGHLFTLSRSGIIIVGHDKIQELSRIKAKYSIPFANVGRYAYADDGQARQCLPEKSCNWQQTYVYDTLSKS